MARAQAQAPRCRDRARGAQLTQGDLARGSCWARCDPDGGWEVRWEGSANVDDGTGEVRSAGGGGWCRRSASRGARAAGALSRVFRLASASGARGSLVARPFVHGLPEVLFVVLPSRACWPLPRAVRPGEKRVPAQEIRLVQATRDTHMICGTHEILVCAGVMCRARDKPALAGTVANEGFVDAHGVASLVSVPLG